MKKSLITMALLTGAFTAHADTLAGGDIEVNTWQPDYKYQSSDDGDSTEITIEASFEHPIPLIPNIKYAQSAVDAKKFEYTKRDYILYYEILDNDLVSFDIGAGATHLSDGKITLPAASTQKFSGYVPTLYAMGEIGLPATPLFIFAKGTGIAYSDTQLMDLSAGLKYEIGLGLIGLELQAGYRSQTFDLEDFDSLTVDLDTSASGFFAGVNIDF